MYETLIWEETFPGCSLNEHNWNRRVGNWQLSSDWAACCAGLGKQRAAILHATQSGGQRRHLKNHRPPRGGTRTVWDPLSIYLSPNRYPWEIFPFSTGESRSVPDVLLETGFGQQSGCCRRIASTALGQPPERSISMKQKGGCPKAFSARSTLEVSVRRTPTQKTRLSYRTGKGSINFISTS